MKNFCKKIKAFTLAEVAITMMVVALIASTTIKIIKSKTTYYLNSFMTYSAFTSLQSAMEELVSIGCSTADLAATPLVPPPPHPYCTTQYSLPIIGHTGDSRGLCDRLLDEEINNVGAPNCALTATSGFATANPNFVTTNGMKFFNFGSSASTIAPFVYTVYVDIDGPKRNAVLNEDVIKFNVYTNGTVLPAPDSKAATDKMYISASVKYWDSTIDKYNYLKVSTSYKDAICTAYKAQTTDINYCTGFPANTSCQNGTYDCKVILNKPEFLFGH